MPTTYAEGITREGQVIYRGGNKTMITVAGDGKVDLGYPGTVSRRQAAMLRDALNAYLADYPLTEGVE